MFRLRCALLMRRSQSKYELSPSGQFPRKTGENVGNAVGIERQKGRAARKRVWILRVKRVKDEIG